jgi:hypothetical protein
MKKKYRIAGECKCKPWKSASFCLFGGWSSEDPKDEIKFCPWCGRDLRNYDKVDLL